MSAKETQRIAEDVHGVHCSCTYREGHRPDCEQVAAIVEAIEQAEARGRRSEAKLNPAYLRAFAEGRDAGLEEAAEVVQNRPNLLLRTTREEANKKCGGGVMREVAEEIRALKRGGRER